jgi:hypothetical protein
MFVVIAEYPSLLTDSTIPTNWPSTDDANSNCGSTRMSLTHDGNLTLFRFKNNPTVATVLGLRIDFPVTIVAVPGFSCE